MLVTDIAHCKPQYGQCVCVGSGITIIRSVSILYVCTKLINEPVKNLVCP